MVVDTELTDHEVDRLFQALANRTRREVLRPALELLDPSERLLERFDQMTELITTTEGERP